VTEFKLPELGENIDQGDLVRLMVSLGAASPKENRLWNWETTRPGLELHLR